jgi:autotransporter-associated beta strand protein
MVKHLPLHYRHHSSPQSKSSIRARPKGNAMTTSWKDAVSGDWSEAADWTFGKPNATKVAVINATGTYTVTVSSANTAQSLTIDAASATLSEDTGGSLTMVGSLTLDSGTVILNGANSFGAGTNLFGGILKLGSAAALGTGGLTLSGGTLVGTENMRLHNTVTIDSERLSTLAAAHGDSLTLAGRMSLSNGSGGIITFGQGGNDGIVTWNPKTLGISNDGTSFSVDINAGILRDGNGSLGKLLGAALSVDVAAQAGLNLRGHADTIVNLSGKGTIFSAIAGGDLTVGNGNFSGIISGALALTVGGSLTLTGANIYTGGTIVDSGASLSLIDAGSIAGEVTLETGSELTIQNHGAITGGVIISSGAQFSWLHGSVGGDIVDNGLLNFGNASKAQVVQSTISGTGSLQISDGKVILDGTNTFSGGTNLVGGILKVGNPSALGTGALSIAHGTFMGTTTEAISNQLEIQGGATFLALRGTTLTLDSSLAWTISGTPTITFGNANTNGVIVWDTPAEATGPELYITISGGTLRVGSSNFQTLLNEIKGVPFTIDHLGTLDVAGFSDTIYDLYGSGALENSGASATVTVSGGYFSGTISGNTILDIDGSTTLGGNAENWGTINLLSGAQLTLKGASLANIVFPSGSSTELILNDASEFKGSIGNFHDTLVLAHQGFFEGYPPISYSGNATGGTLTVGTRSGSVNIAMVGDYTNGTFGAGASGTDIYINFSPNPPAANVPSVTAHADMVDFSNLASPQAAPEVGITHLHGGHGANEIAFAHDVTEMMHAHDPMLEHFVHDLFAHHVMPEALI